MPITASAVANSLAQVAQTIANISDMEKRRKFEQNFAALDYDQKIKLNKALLAANSEQARQQLLGDTLSKLDVARIEGLATVQSEKEKTKKTIYIISGIAVIIIISAIAIIRIKRK
jgi:hypothetical protein